LYNCSVVMDIPTIIFGGEYLHLGDDLFDSIKEVIEQSPSPFKPRVIQSSLRESASTFGGFAVGRDEILRSELRL